MCQIVTCVIKEKEQLAVLSNNIIYPTYTISSELPNTMNELLNGGNILMEKFQNIVGSFLNNNPDASIGYPIKDIKLLAPVPHPSSFRDAYAFRQHVETSRANRGLEMIPEFDEFPVFYFSNHLAIQGPGEIHCMPRHFEQLDFELEVAIVINKQGRNIKAKDADQYIGGFMILNDFSARKLQMEEMKLNLGPAKGKDFASAFGPYLVPSTALKQFLTETKDGHIGNTYDLSMSCKVNNKLVSKGNLKDMHWTFAEIIERASYGVTLYPGDIIGSGTVGTGCFLELNGTGLRKDLNYKTQWLNPGDNIELEVTALGTLKNQVLLEEIN